MESLLIIGNYIQAVKCENYRDPFTNRIRVRPLPNQGIPTDLAIECSMYERERHSLGTRFTTIDCKVCKKPDGRIYLRAKDQMIYKID